jgi:tetratricopeptide (TPR) repeat protein
VFGSDHIQLAAVAQAQAELDLTQGRYADARAKLKAVLEWRERKGKDNPALLSTREAIARLNLLEGKLQEAGVEIDQILTLRANVYGPAHYARHSALGLKAEAFLRSDRVEQAEKPAQETLEIREAVYDGDHPETAAARLLLARVLIVRNDLSGAEKLVAAAREAIQKRPAEHPDRAELAWVAARLAAARKNLTDAERLYDEALRLRDNVLAKEHPETQRLVAEMVALLTGAGKADRAKALQARAK